jgi:hypothetical protein
VQDDFGARRHADLRQHGDLVAEREIGDQQTLVFGDGIREVVLPLGVRLVDLGPGRDEEDASMREPGFREGLQNGSTVSC